jgi:hypothetical protein
MTNENEVDQTVSTQESVAAPQALAAPEAVAAPDPVVSSGGVSRTAIRTESTRATTVRPQGSELTRRVVVLIFGLIQLVIALRFVLLLLDAREANGLVSGILNISQVFVAPFDGILRTDNLHAAGSIFDLTAIVALVGWTIIEMVVLWAIGIFRREPA